MTHVLNFRPEVEDEAAEAYAFYEARSVGLGEAFLRLFYSSASAIAEDPLRFPKVHGEFRRRLLTRFPYAVYFRLTEDTILIAALCHCARDRGAITRMLRDRDSEDL